MRTDPAIAPAYRHCRERAAAHYENFPVASYLLPRRLRGPVAAIYCYARDADDLADEDPRPPQERRNDLLAMQTRVRRLANPTPEFVSPESVSPKSGEAESEGAESVWSEPEWAALADTIRRFHLPAEPFTDLADAFLQDLEKTRYTDFGEVMGYCRRSANPVGRLLLHLNDAAGPENLAHSDAVCSALQLINFYQDLHQDFAEHGRIYLPEDEMATHGVTSVHLQDRINDHRMRALMQVQYRRADRLLRAGAPLGGALRGRLGLEIRAIIQGGARTLWLLRQQQNVFSRPRLRRQDWLRIFARSLFPARHR